MRTLQITLLYQDGETRTYAFVASGAVPNTVRTKIQAINASISEGTDDGLSTTFVSDYGGNLTRISGAKIINEVDTEIFGGEF